MRSFVRPLFVALGIALAAPLVACGGANEGQGAADPSRPPPRDVLAMPVRVQPGSNSAFGAALADALARAGFTVATDPSTPTDVILTPTVNVSQSTSAFQVTVNGRTKMKISVRVAVVCAGQLADMLHVDYNDYDGEPPDDEAIATLVLAYAHSARVAAFAKKRASAIAAATSEDDAWAEANVARCSTPTTVDACDGVKAYVKAYPQGKHAGEATRLLAQVGPQFERLQKDESSWQSADAGDCRAKKTRESCVGVEVYLTKFPNGAHAREAHEILGK
jgi:hypothetical protein